MIPDLENAKQHLLTGEFTCVLCKNSDIHTSSHRGVMPLLKWIWSERDFAGFSAADKVVGKATAFLYVLLRVEAVFANVISRPALEILQKNGITAEYTTLTDNITNRQGDGICPFEEAVLDTEDVKIAYEKIYNKAKEMKLFDKKA